MVGDKSSDNEVTSHMQPLFISFPRLLVFPRGLRKAGNILVIEKMITRAGLSGKPLCTPCKIHPSPSASERLS